MAIFSDKIRVGVLRGGPSHEYKVSLDTGASVLENLDREIYEPLDIYISKDGIWHDEGFERSPENIIKKIDVIFNALHGEYGEDGTVQKMLDSFSIPYTGSDPMASMLGMNKIASKKVFKNEGLKTPYAISLDLGDLSRDRIKEIYKSMPSPFIVKPVASGSSLGVYLAHSLPELEEMVVASFDFGPTILIEEYISGKEATVGVIDGYRNQEYYSLMPVEIRPRSERGLFDFNSKYSPDGAHEICPGNFTPEEKVALEKAALAAHRSLGMRHYSRSDFRVHPKRGVFILETNSLPELTNKSRLRKALESAGSNISEFLHHVINRALGK